MGSWLNVKCGIMEYVGEGQHTTPEARGSQATLREEGLLILEEPLDRAAHYPSPGAERGKVCGWEVSPCSKHDISGTTLLLT